MKKRVILFLLCIVAVFSVYGGGQKDSAEAAGKASLEVWIWGWNEAAAKVIEEDAKAWTEKTGVEINIVPLSLDAYLEKLPLVVAGGTNPDISFLGNYADLIVNDKLLNLNEFGAWEHEDKFYDALWDSMVYDGGVYGFRVTSNNLGLFYNKALFDEAGIPYPTNDWTWEDLRKNAKALTDPTKNQFGIELPVYTTSTSWKLHLWKSFLWQAGGELMGKNGVPLFNTPEGVAAADFWNTLVNVDKSAPKNAPGPGVDRFLTEKVAMTVNGPWNLQNYNSDPNLKDKWDVVFLPKGRMRATTLGGEGIAAFKNTSYPKEAYEYMVHLATDTDFLEEWWTEWVTVPPLKELSNMYDNDPELGRHMRLFSEQTQYARADEIFGEGNLFAEILSSELEEMIFNNKSAKEALQSAHDEIVKKLGPF
jgi:ABC-type glycerol-3-phosphate transport system substrate-binding protein